MVEDRAKIEWLRGATQDGIDAIERGEYVTLSSLEAIADHLRGLRGLRARGWRVRPLRSSLQHLRFGTFSKS